MTTFAYVAVEPSGKRKTGVLEASTKQAAMDQIAREGRYLLEIREQASRRKHYATGPEKRRKGRVSKSELALFTRRLSDLSAAGLPLDRVLQVVAEQSESGTLSEVSSKVLEDVRGGMPVSAALAQHPRLFPEVYTQTLKAGEASGQFPQVASRIADFQEREVSQRSQIISALIYPAVLTGTAVMVVAFLMLYVVPKLSGVFKDLGSDLPFSTVVLLSTSDFVMQNWLWLACAIAGGVVGFRVWSATESGALIKDRAFFRTPLIGPVAQKATVSRYARVLGTLVYGGVPILDSLHLAGLSVGNRVFRSSSDIVAEDVREGRPIAEAMRDAGGFPPVLTHMVAIGEETGDLPKMLGRVADTLDFEVETGMRRLTSIVEPVVVLAMGTFVGFVVLSVLLPIFQAQNLVK